MNGAHNRGTARFPADEGTTLESGARRRHTHDCLNSLVHGRMLSVCGRGIRSSRRAPVLGIPAGYRDASEGLCRLPSRSTHHALAARRPYRDLSDTIALLLAKHGRSEYVFVAHPFG